MGCTTSKAEVLLGFCKTEGSAGNEGALPTIARQEFRRYANLSANHNILTAHQSEYKAVMLLVE